MLFEATLAISAAALVALLLLWARFRRQAVAGLGRTRVPKEVPAWAGNLDRDELHAFTEILELSLAERELEAVQRDGIVAVALPDGRPLQLGLQNLAQQCAHLPRRRWRVFVNEHIDALLGAEAEANAFDRTRFDSVKRLLKVRLYATEALKDSDADAVVLARPAPGLEAVLVYDLPHTVSTVPRDELAAWGRSEEELLALGLENLASEESPDREDVELERGVVLRLFSGASFFVSSHLLHLRTLLPQKLEYGALVCAPTRHLLLIHTIRDSRVLLAINAMIPQSYLHYQRGPGSLSPNVYWWHHGQLTHLPTSVQSDAVKFTPPPEFVQQVMEPLAKD